jgi:hypothetical protein
LPACQKVSAPIFGCPTPPCATDSLPIFDVADSTFHAPHLPGSTYGVYHFNITLNVLASGANVEIRAFLRVDGATIKQGIISLTAGSAGTIQIDTVAVVNDFSIVEVFITGLPYGGGVVDPVQFTITDARFAVARSGGSINRAYNHYGYRFSSAVAPLTIATVPEVAARHDQC